MATDRLPGSIYARLRREGYSYTEIVTIMAGTASMWVYGDVVQYLRSEGILPSSVHVDSNGQEKAWVNDDDLFPIPPPEIPASPIVPMPTLEAPKMNMDKADYRSTGMPQPQTRRIDMQEVEHSTRLSDLRQDIRLGVMFLLLLTGALSAISYISGLAGHLVSVLFCLAVVVLHVVFRSRHDLVTAQEKEGDK